MRRDEAGAHLGAVEETGPMQGVGRRRSTAGDTASASPAPGNDGEEEGTRGVGVDAEEEAVEATTNLTTTDEPDDDGAPYAAADEELDGGRCRRPPASVPSAKVKRVVPSFHSRGEPAPKTTTA